MTFRGECSSEGSDFQWWRYVKVHMERPIHGMSVGCAGSGELKELRIDSNNESRNSPSRPQDTSGLKPQLVGPVESWSTKSTIYIDHSNGKDTN